MIVTALVVTAAATVVSAGVQATSDYMAAREAANSEETVSNNETQVALAEQKNEAEYNTQLANATEELAIANQNLGGVERGQTNGGGWG